MKHKSSVTSKSILGQMIRLCEQSIKIELGMPGNLFSTPYRQMYFLTTNSWIKNPWQFVNLHSITLQDSSPALDLTTDKDQFLMDLFIKASLPKRDLINLNKCRKYLKVLTGNGKSIMHSVGSKIFSAYHYNPLA